jgi:hypothetical protein
LLLYRHYGKIYELLSERQHYSAKSHTKKEPNPARDNSFGKKDQAQKKKNRTTHTFKRTSGRENNWDLYNHQDGISHTQQCCDIKRTQPLFVHRFHIVKNDKIIKQHIDNVYCSAKIKIV